MSFDLVYVLYRNTVLQISPDSPEILRLGAQTHFRSSAVLHALLRHLPT